MSLGLLQVTNLNGHMDAQMLQSPININIDNLKNANFKVTTINCDGESSLKSIRQYISEVATLIQIGPDQHVPIIERTI